MQRPIEKFGWKKGERNRYSKRDVLLSISFLNDGMITIQDCEGNTDYISLEELQAIYETAIEIKRETEMDNQILCNRCENTCYYGLEQCDNFKERKKENEN